MLAWVWVWADLESVGQDARRENVSEPLGEVEITSWSLGRCPDRTIHAFVVRESIGPDAGSPGAADDGLAVRLVVEAVLDRRRCSRTRCEPSNCCRGKETSSPAN